MDPRLPCLSRARRVLAAALSGLVLAGCGGAPESPELRIRSFQAAPGWTSQMQTAHVIRLRRNAGEALLDLGVIPVGAGASFASFDAVHRHYGAGSKIERDEAVTIGGLSGRRIAFSGSRPDTGQPTAGVRYLLDRGAQVYHFEFLAAGDVIEEARREADAMMQAVRFEP